MGQNDSAHFSVRFQVNIVGTMFKFLILMALVLSLSVEVVSSELILMILTLHMKFFVQFVSCQRQYPKFTRKYSNNRSSNLSNFKPFNNGRSQRRNSYTTTTTTNSNRRSFNTNQVGKQYLTVQKLTFPLNSESKYSKSQNIYRQKQLQQSSVLYSSWRNLLPEVICLKKFYKHKF